MAWKAKVQNSSTDPASGKLRVYVTYYDGDPDDASTPSWSPGALEFEPGATVAEVNKAIKEQAKTLKSSHSAAAEVKKLHDTVIDV